MFRTIFLATVSAQIWLCACFASQANDFTDRELQAQTQLLDIYATSLVSKADLAMSAIGEVFSVQEMPERDGHELLGRFVEKLKGVRALIYIDAAGQLKFDSFSYPAADVNLSSREYFVSAKSVRNAVVIGEPVIGKTSSIPFIPIARRVDKDGVFDGVLVAIVTPESMVVPEHYSNCAFCVSLITDLQGNILAQFPVGMQINDDLRDKLAMEKRSLSGVENVKSGELDIRLVWQRSSTHPLMAIFLEFQGN